MLRNAFKSAVKGVNSVGRELLSRGLGRSGQLFAAAISEDYAPIVTVDVAGQSLRFFCPGRMPVHRAQKILTKEPDTIQWLDGFAADEVFWDIGANVGVYSVYAAAVRKCRVWAFEPAPANFYLLSRNVQVNRLDQRVSTYCLAFDDKTQPGYFHMQETDVGAALNNYETSGSDGATFTQTTLGFRIDDAIRQFGFPVPNHLKIDVDGNELRILQGAEVCLADPQLKSVSVEVDVDSKNDPSAQLLARFGFAERSEPARGSNTRRNAHFFRTKS